MCYPTASLLFLLLVIWDLILIAGTLSIIYEGETGLGTQINRMQGGC